MVFFLVSSAPLYAGFIDIRVDQSSDDAEENVSTGAVNLTSSDMELVFDGSTQQLVGLRFQDVTIPQGATIVSAVLEFETDETDSGSTSVVIRGEDADDAATFTTTNSDISSRTTTTASVAWSSIPAWNTVNELHQSPDLTSIVQEIVDRPGWASDNDMVFIIEAAASGCSSSACQRTAESFNGESDAAPALRIEFDGVIPAPSSSICYSVADSNDELKEIPTSGASAGSPTTVGDTEGSSIEALAYQVKHGVLYGADGDQLGRINRNTGEFFALEETFGTGTATIGGSPTSVTFSDIDGLSFDPTTAVLYGSNASPGADELFVILFRTGEYLDDAFGTGEDFVELSGTGSDDIGNQVDDIAFDPDDNGQLYATDGDELYSVDKATGETTLVADLRVGSTTGTDVIDMEGLSFDDSGQLYGTTGTSGPASTRNRLWTIDKSTGVATQVGTGALGSGTDYESVECVFTSDLTHVTVTSFEATEVDGKTVVEWTTAGEAGTAGFELLRWNERENRYTKLHPGTLPGLLTAPQGGVYRFVDETAEAGDTLEYLLVEQEVSSRKRRLGPYRVTVQASAHAQPIELRASRAGFSREPHRRHSAVKPAAAKVASPGAPEGRRRGRIAVHSAGLYFIPASEVAAALAMTGPEVLARRATWRLSHRGQRVSTFQEEGFDGLFFYGESVESIYTDENVYWLDLADADPSEQEAMFSDSFESGGASRWSLCSDCSTARRSLPRSKTASGFLKTVRFEEDHTPVTSVAGDPEEGLWYWQFLLGGDPGVGARDFTLQTENLIATGSAQLTLEILSASSSTAPVDHHIVVLLNGQEIAEDAWNGAERRSVSAEFDAGLLVEGDNVVTVTGLLEPDVDLSVLFVDGFELRYPSRFEAVDDRLFFESDRNGTVTVEGFTSDKLGLFQLSSPFRPRRIRRVAVGGEPGSHHLSFVPRDRLTPYLAVDLSRVESLGVEPFVAEELEQGEAEYLVVTSSELSAGAERLADYRRSRGLATRVVTLEQIYSSFNHGIEDPKAIADFLLHASQHWNLPPRFAVLVGDGDFDYKNVFGLGENHVPPLLISTPHGLAGSDRALADFLAIGRLPVRTAVELDGVVDKILTYEASGGIWRRHVLLVADHPDEAGDFTAASDAVAARLSTSASYERIYLAEQPAPDARELLLERLDEGAGVLNYVGHGGVDRLADEGLLIRDDAGALANGARLPVVLALTCLAGRFDLPGFASLGESLVRAPENGAVAFLGPVLLSSNADAAVLNQALAESISSGRWLSLGEAILDAQRQLLETGSANRSMPYVYNLLGDPALELP